MFRHALKFFGAALTAFLTACTTTGPLFEGVTPAAAGKCVVYIYYVSEITFLDSAPPPLYIDNERVARLDTDRYVRRELTCDPHRFQIAEFKNFYLSFLVYSSANLTLREGSPAFLKITGKRVGGVYSGLGRPVWSFKYPDDATALSELKK